MNSRLFLILSTFWTSFSYPGYILCNCYHRYNLLKIINSELSGRIVDVIDNVFECFVTYWDENIELINFCPAKNWYISMSVVLKPINSSFWRKKHIGIYSTFGCDNRSCDNFGIWTVFYVIMLSKYFILREIIFNWAKPMKTFFYESLWTVWSYIN